MKIDYNPESKSLFIRWGEDFNISEDHGDYVLDLDKNKNIIGIELLNFDVEKATNAGKYFTYFAGCTLPGGPMICPQERGRELGECVKCERRKRVEGD